MLGLSEGLAEKEGIRSQGKKTMENQVAIGRRERKTTTED